jgi:hypothetical protein
VSNVRIIRGLSEQILPQLLPEVKGEVNFWLDGHYSGHVTYKGPQETPIVEELKCIDKFRQNFSKLIVLIDDVRLFTPSHRDYISSYPTLDYLVDWSRSGGLQWSITHDVFIALS